MNKRTNLIMGLVLSTLAGVGCNGKGEVHGLASGENLAFNVKRAEAAGDPLWVHLIFKNEQCLVAGNGFQGTVNGAPLEVASRGGEIDDAEGTACVGISLKGPAATPGQDLTFRVWDDTLTIEAQFPDVATSPLPATKCTGAASCTLIRTATTK
jgi:hypothetical protein